jgi:GT2 family glycosyltransferase
MAAEPAARAAPAISVIIPTCRRPDLLLDCVASILRNDFQDYEVIIVDQDGDGSLEAALRQRFDGDARLVYVPLDRPSASQARNVAVRRARGRILVFSDDDTEVEPDWLRAYVEAFDACDNAPAVVGGRLDPLWLEPRPAWLPAGREYLLGIYNRHEGLIPMPEHDQPIGANFAVHREVMDAVGPFDERLGPSYARRRGMIFGEDALLSLLARKAKYPVYFQAAARSWHKISARKLRKRYFVRRSFWEGVTLLCVLHLAGTIPADRWPRVLAWHSRESLRAAWRLVRALARWRRAANPAEAAMEAVYALAHSAGVMRAAVRLGTSGRLPW